MISFINLIKSAWILSLLVFTVTLNALEWEKPASISDAAWQKAEPYLLPRNHPAARILDNIFSKQASIGSKRKLRRAGFESPKQNYFKQAVITRHPKLTGYVLKLYLDDQTEVDELLFFTKRIEGSRRVQEAILAFGCEKFFSVPEKWLYPLPDVANRNPNRKNFVLLVSDMKLVDTDVNLRSWYTRIDKERLTYLYKIISTLGLFDSLYISNIPFTKSGKISFVDTEWWGGSEINYYRLDHVLNPEMRAHWHHLINTNGQ